jgi:hypothetical protein
VLGRYGFWPLAILDDGTKTGEKVEALPKPVKISNSQHKYQFSPPLPVLWKILYGLVLLVVAMFGVLLTCGSLTASSSAMTLLAPVKDSHRSALIAVVGWILLMALLLLAWPSFAWRSLDYWPIISTLGVLIAAFALCGTCTWELSCRESPRTALIFITVSIALVVGFFVVNLLGGHSRNPFLYRYVHLTSGVSPLLPFLCLLAAGLWWAWFSLSGLALVDKRRPQLPASKDISATASSGHIGPTVAFLISVSEKSAESLIRLAQPAAWDTRVGTPVIAILAVSLFGLDHCHPVLSLETRHYEWIYAIALGGVAFTLFCTLFRLLLIWLECRKLLNALDRLPLRRAFGELRFAWEPMWRFGGGRWQDLYRLVSRQTESLEHLNRVLPKDDSEETAKHLRDSVEDTAKQQDKLLKSYADFSSDGACAPNAKKADLCDSVMCECEDFQKKIARTCGFALVYLQPKWRDGEGLILCEVNSRQTSETKASADTVQQDGKPQATISMPTRLAERFVALVYLNFILIVLLRMRTLVITAGGLYIFLLLSVNSYPFEPKVALRSLAIALLTLVVGMVGYVFAQLHRDPILSLVTQTNPGELGIEFWLRMGTFVALPLLSLMISQFPSLNNAVFSWLEPAANALK